MPDDVGFMMRRGFARHVLLQYTVRRVQAADEARAEQLLPLAAAAGSELATHPEFIGGLVVALMDEAGRRLTPRLARAAISQCLLPLAATLPHAHKQLLRLLVAQWQVLHKIPAENIAAEGDVQNILNSRGIGEGSLLVSISQRAGGDAPGAPPAAASAGAGEGVLSLLQYAARTANETGATAPGEDKATERAYEKLGKLVPGLLGGRGRLQ